MRHAAVILWYTLIKTNIYISYLNPQRRRSTIFATDGVRISNMYFLDFCAFCCLSIVTSSSFIWCFNLGADVLDLRLFLIFQQPFSCYYPWTRLILRWISYKFTIYMLPSDRTARWNRPARLGTLFLKRETELSSRSPCDTAICLNITPSVQHNYIFLEKLYMFWIKYSIIWNM